MRWRFLLLGVFLPLLTLLLGWQLGVQVERNRFSEEREDLAAHFALVGSGVTVEGDPERSVDLTLLWTVWRMLQQHYVDPQALTVDEMRFGAVRGLVEAISDPYTTFMTPKDSTDFQRVMRGQLKGIGAELQMRDHLIIVVAPLRGSPAQKAGLLPRDVIVAVDGQDVRGQSLDDVVGRIRGEEGTSVTLTVFRPLEDRELQLSIVREEIHVPSVESRRYVTDRGSVAVLAVNQFGDETNGEISAAVRAVDPRTVSGMVLDLRFNGGGYLDAAVHMVSLFLQEGKVVTVERRGEQPKTHYVLGRPLLPTLPLVVLINEGSASASEIVSGSLQDAKRATVLGASSFGKGSVQEVIDIPGGSALRLTVARWLTPSGRSIGAQGIAPDIAVPMSPEDYRSDRDPQRDAAVRFLLTGDRDPTVLTATGALAVTEVKG